jgi:hypothetical protein
MTGFRVTRAGAILGAADFAASLEFVGTVADAGIKRIATKAVLYS